MQAALAAPRPLDLSSEGRVLYLEDPGHDPAAFLWLLVISFSPILREPLGLDTYHSQAHARPAQGRSFPDKTRGAKRPDFPGLSPLSYCAPKPLSRAFRTLAMPGFRKTYVTPSIAPNLALLP